MFARYDILKIVFNDYRIICSCSSLKSYSRAKRCMRYCEPSYLTKRTFQPTVMDVQGHLLKEKCETNNKSDYILYVSPFVEYAQPNFGSWYQIVADFRVVKMVMEPVYGYWKAIEIGEYVFFPSETLYIFVNYTNQNEQSSSNDNELQKHQQTTIKIRYCAHRSHTPSLNFNDVLHREPVREEWPKLVKCLQNLQKIRRIDETINMVRTTYKRCCENT